MVIEWLIVMHCNVQRWSRRVCRIELDFKRFEMVYDDHCLLNHFEVGGQHLCGNQTGRNSKLYFHFNSVNMMNFL